MKPFGRNEPFADTLEPAHGAHVTDHPEKYKRVHRKWFEPEVGIETLGILILGMDE